MSAGSHALAHAPNRKTYWIVFFVLGALTVLEVAVTYVKSVGKGTIIVVLVGLALTKAACVLLWYMHLIHETSVLKKTVIFPFAFPALYALVLVSEGAWRGLWGAF